MDEQQAADVFDALAESAPHEASVSIDGALAELERQRITSQEAAALQYYADEGQPLAVLAARVNGLAAAAVAAAAAAAPLSWKPGLTEHETRRRLFQDAVVSFAPGLGGAVGAARVRRLLERMTWRLGVARSQLERAQEDQVDAWMAVRDCLDAAALATLLAEAASSEADDEPDAR